MSDDTINVLTDVSTLEVTLCRRGKNQKRWALAKSIDQQEDHMKEYAEVLKSIMEVEAGNEGKITDVFKSLSDKGTVAVKTALRVLNAFKDELPADVMVGITSLAGYDAPVHKSADPAPVTVPPVAPKKVGYVPIKKSDGTYDFDGIPDEVRPALAQLWSEREQVATEMATLQKSLQVECDAREQREWIAKAADLVVPGKTPEELGATLKRINDADPDLAEGQLKIFQATSEALKKSALLDEVGKAGRNRAGTGGAWEKIEKMAATYVEKSGDEPLTQAKAIDRVLRDKPELYNEYLAENSAQTQRS